MRSLHTHAPPVRSDRPTCSEQTEPGCSRAFQEVVQPRAGRRCGHSPGYFSGHDVLPLANCVANRIIHLKFALGESTFDVVPKEQLPRKLSGQRTSARFENSGDKVALSFTGSDAGRRDNNLRHTGQRGLNRPDALFPRILHPLSRRFEQRNPEAISWTRKNH